MERAPPQSISEYTLLEFLGEGATAQVYLAEHETLGRHVAIKVIDKLLVQRSQLESKVRQEMVLHAELQHPHVLRVESVFEDARNYYMVLEYCARRSLAAIVKTLPGRQMDEQTAKQIFRQVVKGVEYLHASGVIHRDLKLANLLLNGDEEVKISDFGLAARLGEDHVTMCGTPNFIAPEVLTAENGPYDEAVDVWSLGCILYCLVLGKAPFEGRKVSETLENVANAGQNPLKFPDGISSSAIDLIKRLLNPEPRSRPSATQILQHPWLREHSQKRAPPLPSGRRRSQARMPLYPRVWLGSPKHVREKRKNTAFRSMKEDKVSLASTSLSMSSKPRRRRTLANSHEHRGLQAPVNMMRFTQFQSMQSAPGNTSSDSSASSDDNDGELGDDFSDLSELSLQTFNSRDKREEEEDKTSGRADTSFCEVSTISTPVVSVIMHLELQEDLTLFGISQTNTKSPSTTKVQLQWSCCEPAEVGKPPTFTLKVSNGWQACYNPATGVLTATTSEGDSLCYEIPGVNGERTTSSAVSIELRMSPSRSTQRAVLLPLVRFCQCLALRALQLRHIALRGEASKLPFVHYDTLPESLLASFRHRFSFLNQGANDEACLSQETRSETQYGVSIVGIGRGYIDASGDLKVVYLDGAQLTLAASGLQLRFRPSWTNESSSETSSQEDVFELLTSGSMSSFLPSAVKQKLESIPEFIRRLKAVSCYKDR